MSGLAGEKGKEGLQAPPEKPTSFMEVKGKLLALPTPTEAKAVMGNGEKTTTTETCKARHKTDEPLVGMHLLVWVDI